MLFLLLSLWPEKYLLQNANPPQVCSRTDLSSYCAQLLRNLDNRQSDGPCQLLTHTLPILNSVITHSPDCLTEGDKDTFHIGIKVEKQHMVISNLIDLTLPPFLPQIMWRSWVKSLLTGCVMPASLRGVVLHRVDFSRGQDHARWVGATYFHFPLPRQAPFFCLLCACTRPSATTHHWAGRDSVRGFLHCPVRGPGLHRGPVDECLLLLHASPLATHLSLCFQW